MDKLIELRKILVSLSLAYREGAADLSSKGSLSEEDKSTLNAFEVRRQTLDMVIDYIDDILFITD